MPLRQLEPFLFPENLFLDWDREESSARWWVVHTKPRVEKAMARLLLRSRQAFFLPLYERQWRNKNRLFRSFLPLFPGYLFVLGAGRACLAPMEKSLASRVLFVPDQSQLQGNLTQVYRLITSGLTPTPEKRLQPGTAVEILSGPLAGLQGKVLRRGNRLNFVIAVQFLQCGVSVELDSSMIRPLAQPASA